MKRIILTIDEATVIATGISEKVASTISLSVGEARKDRRGAVAVVR